MIGDKSGELLLREVVKRWREYKFIVRWMTSLFMYLDQFFTCIRHDHRMGNTALLLLHKLIDVDHDGHSVHRALIGRGFGNSLFSSIRDIKCNISADFELALLDSSDAYYLNKMANWHQNLPYPEYMSKVVECTNAENFRAMQYLHPSTVQKLLERIKSLHPILNRIDGNNLANKVQQLKLLGVLSVRTTQL